MEQTPKLTYTYVDAEGKAWCAPALPLPAGDDWSRAIAELAESRLRFVMENRERLAEAFIAETGLRPSECEIVEQDHGDGRLTIRIQRRTEAPG